MQVMAGLEAARVKPATAVLPNTAQGRSCTPEAGSAAMPEPPQHQQQQQQQPSCAPSQAENCLPALPIMKAEVHGIAELDQLASGCSAISTLPMPCIVENRHNGCSAHQTPLHGLSSAMEMDAGRQAQNSHAEECTHGVAARAAVGSNQLAGQGETGRLAVGSEASGLSQDSGIAREDASLASKGLMQEADGDDIAPVAAGFSSEGMYPVGVTTYTEASAFASTAGRASICVILPRS